MSERFVWSPRKLGLAILLPVLLSGCGGEENPYANLGKYYSWMSTEIVQAWKAGYFGQGVRVLVVDEFAWSVHSDPIEGDLGPGPETKLHGDWTSQQVQMIAPAASVDNMDYATVAPITLARDKLNVVNLSYGVLGMAANGTSTTSPLERSIVNAADGDAVIVKAAGNYSVAVDGAAFGLAYDYLNLDLIGKDSAIFVGALSANGTPTSQATLADYSNYAGSNLNVQNQFLVVGVEEDKTGLAGTSFAAPIVSGYAAVLGSKFTSATPTQIANQLLDTARTDTIKDYSRSIHGRGEASITRALAPVTID